MSHLFGKDASESEGRFTGGESRRDALKITLTEAQEQEIQVFYLNLRQTPLLESATRQRVNLNLLYVAGSPISNK